MDKLLSFLFRETSNGATYLQTIIMSGLLIAGLFYLFKMIGEVLEEIKSGEVNKQDENETTKKDENM